MSDTPETDEARMKGYGEFGGDWSPLDRNCYEKDSEGNVVFCEVAEKLERERDEARRERDEARKELASMQKALVRLIKRWKRREKEYLNASNDEWDTGDKYASRRYYGEAIGTHWAIDELIAIKLIAKMKKEAK